MSDVANANAKKKHVVVAGASGFVGNALLKELADHGWQISVLMRGEPETPSTQTSGHTAGADGADSSLDQSSQTTATPDAQPHDAQPHDAQPHGTTVDWREFSWDPDNYQVDPHIFTDADAVVCLNGAPLAKWPWTKDYKKQLVASRFNSVKTIAQAIDTLPEDQRPTTFLSASAVGYYGDQGDKALTENDPADTDFLAGLCARWEALSQEAQIPRVVNIRTGLVVEAGGGLVGALEPIFKFYLGGRLGDGSQWMPTISRRDHVRAIRYLLEHEQLSGAFNLSAPHPVTNEEFTRALADYYDRPVSLSVPAPVLRMVLGDMATLALVSQKVIPKRLQEAGFEFRDLTIEQQLRSSAE